MVNPAAHAPSARRATVDPQRCDRCGSCVGVCLPGALRTSPDASCAKCVKYCSSMEVPCHPWRVVVEPGQCDGCGRCLAACQARAITLVPAA